MNKLLISCLLLTASLEAATFTVKNTSDSDPFSLRDAINQVNAGTFDTIEFAVTGTIMPVTSLPTITMPVLIDGYSAPGASPNTNPINQPNNAVITIEIQGPGPNFAEVPIDDSTAPALYGLRLGEGSDGSTIQGLCINSFATVKAEAVDDAFISTNVDGAGILIESSENTIQGNFLGSDLTGEISRPNACAVMVGNPTLLVPVPVFFNTIGGDTNDARNLISGNFDTNGDILDFFAVGTTIQGNTIGLDRSGTVSLQPESTVGVLTFVSFGLTIEGNVVSGNDRANLFIELADQVTIQDNVIGPDVSGTLAVEPRGIGIAIIAALQNSPSTFIIDSNQISANTYGIMLGDNIDSDLPIIGAQITNNSIGLDSTGQVPLANSLDGLWLAFAKNTFVAGNTISGNARHGIRTGKNKNAQIVTNVIGSDATGTLTSLGNGSDGIRLGTTGVGVQSECDVIGGAQVGEGNLIAFNKGNGIKTVSFVEDETIIGNTIINNSKNGVLIGPYASEINVGIFEQAGNVRLIGDVISALASNLGPLGTSNIIMGNGEDGVKIHNAQESAVQTNIITGNYGTGVKVKDASNNQIGGRDGGSCTDNPVLGNVISDNGHYGVEVEEKKGEAVDNSILSNSILDNERDGIKLKNK